jgi:hypothetical protein
MTREFPMRRNTVRACVDERLRATKAFNAAGTLAWIIPRAAVKARQWACNAHPFLFDKKLLDQGFDMSASL